MSRIYWDAMLFIYWLEDHPVMAPHVERILGRMQARADRLSTSTLTLGEVLVKPMGAGDGPAAAAVRAAFRRPGLELLPFTAAAAERFAALRVLGVPAPSAVHLATAAEAGTDLFLTDDRRLLPLTIPGIHFISTIAAAPI